MTPSAASRRLWLVILVALAIGTIGSLAFVVFADFLSRFPQGWA